MKNLKIIFLPTIAILIIFIGLSSFKAGAEQKDVSTDLFFTPYIKDSEVDSLQKYKISLINYFEPEPDWAPGEKVGTYTEPEIIGHSGILINLQSGNILFEKNSEEKMKIASLTKIMTAVITLEHKKLSDKIYVDSDATSVGENSMGISDGETYTTEELLYGLILNSGNDAAYALAKGTAGNVNRFVEWMNYKAKELGLNNTYFADPSGLNDDTYSTALDLMKLTRYAMKNPEFKKLVKTRNMEVIGNDHKYIYMENQTNLLTTYPGVEGVKTGYTEEAGLCLVTYANNEGKEVIGVVLNSIDRKGDMILMLDHGFYTLGVKVVHHLL